ncbi:MAG: hypothetical protein JW888_10030 [Pirellulales bacterium]|nr:hypothetical protein [Pirellulales bacterium]
MGSRVRSRRDINDAGQDSFLDIVANIVGILIILVMVMGVRAKNAPVRLSIPSPDQQAAERDLQEKLAAEQSLRRTVFETAATIKEVEEAKRARYAERSKLALMSSAAEKMIEQHRQQFGAEARADFDRRRRLAELQSQLAGLQDEYDLARRVKPEAVRVESYPTPLSRTVHGHELHLQFRGGRITVLPWDEIIETLKTEFRHSVNHMRTQTELTGKTPPIGGFRIRYTIERHDVSMRAYEQTGAGGSFIRLKQFSLLPVSNRLGEPLEVALAPGSELREVLAREPPGRTTVTAWVYPDSFDEYRRLKKELYQLGYAVAGRPLPKGELIGGSPNGSRSSAE